MQKNKKIYMVGVQYKINMLTNGKILIGLRVKTAEEL